MRGPLLACIGIAVLVGASPAPASKPLEVRPLSSRLHRDPARQGPLDARTRAYVDIQKERVRRWRRFPDHLTRDEVNWSRWAARRPGILEAAARRGFGDDRLTGTPPDTLRVATIRIDFLTDRGGGRSSGNGRFDLSGPDTLVPPIDRPPHDRRFYDTHMEALRRYNVAQSYGRVEMRADVWPRERDAAYSLGDMEDIGEWKLDGSEDLYRKAVRMFRMMLFAADSQSIARGDRIPWDDYDRILLIHAGSDLQSDLNQDSPLDIPSFTLGVTDSDAVIFPDSTTRPIDRCAVVPETINQDGFYGAVNGVYAHECGHLFFGMSDVYDIASGFPVVGFWSLMDSGNQVGSIVVLNDGTELFATGLLPPSIDPFQRQFAGDALRFQDAAFGDTMSLRAVERHPDVRYVGLTSDEFLLLENRYLAPADSVKLKQDDSTRVVLGPDRPDSLEYDALLPGGGILVWHIDTSAMPLEFTFPIDTALRVNVDLGTNSNPRRRGISVVEADGLADLGDLGSPYLFASPRDPYYRSNNIALADSTQPSLIPHVRTRPHLNLRFLDEPDSVMRFAAFRTWQVRGSPFAADLPPGGPQLLVVDADGGDRRREVCWAGGDSLSADSTALFAMRVDGTGLFGPHAFARLDRRPMREMAAIPIGDPDLIGPTGPSLFAVTTHAAGPDTSSPGGRVWLLRHDGSVVEGWPAPLPEVVTTPPVIAGSYPNAYVFVGCANGRVYALRLDGSIAAVSDFAFDRPVNGRLAVDPLPAQLTDAAGGALPASMLVAAGSAKGELLVLGLEEGVATRLARARGWPVDVAQPGLVADFLWLDFAGRRFDAGATGSCANYRSLVAHHADKLWAFCPTGEGLGGWGHGFGDTLVAGLGAGDPDGDGFPEVLAQTIDSEILFVNASGFPSPGWPKRGTPEHFPERRVEGGGTVVAAQTRSAPLGADMDGDGRAEVVTLNVAGVVGAITAEGKSPAGWPLATGVGVGGTPAIGDLDGDGFVEVIAPDRLFGLYVYTVPARPLTAERISWTMLGGDPGRTSSLPPERTTQPQAASLGPLVRGSFKAYPNPARRSPVSFAYQLTEPAEVDFQILDASGHEVASFRRGGRQSDNLELWEPGGLPAGLYLARVRFKSQAGEHVVVQPVGVLK